jgi:hypothetical protein
MSIINDRIVFFQDIIRTSTEAMGHEFSVSCEAIDTKPDKCLAYLYFYTTINGLQVEVGSKEHLRSIGNYWKSLDPEKNFWGGDGVGVEVNLFERKL